MSRCFPPPWTAQEIPGGFKVLDADGQSLAYVYRRESKADADIAHVLTMDERGALRAKLARCRNRLCFLIGAVYRQILNAKKTTHSAINPASIRMSCVPVGLGSSICCLCSGFIASTSGIC